jgi:double zinc ribbon protein
MDCPSCGEPIPAGQIYCPHCSVRLPHPTTGTSVGLQTTTSPTTVPQATSTTAVKIEKVGSVYCPSCGKSIAVESQFCMFCGRIIPQPPGDTLVSITSQSTGAGYSSPVARAKQQFSCYKGCDAPIVGQCSGYKGNCGRFYCSNHSVGSFCGICADAFARDKALEAAYNDYLQTAQKIGTMPGCVLVGFLAIMLMFFLLPVVMMITGRDPGSFSGSGWVVIIAISIITAVAISIDSNRRRQRKIDRIAFDKPGFREFYSEWSKVKKQENLANTLGVLFTVGEAANAIDQYRMRQDIHQLARDIHEINQG